MWDDLSDEDYGEPCVDEEGRLRQEISELADALRDGPPTRVVTYKDYDYWFSVRTKWAKQLRQARGRLKKLTSK